ncbi:MAG: LptF/LptG family permease [Deltaproteobacteria bacterium]|nr:LptF/LptG family permease [Deltaproteobacteria bacterium]
MPTLWRYTAVRFLSAFAGSLVILALVLLVVDMLLNLGDVIEAGTGFLGAIGLLLQRTTATYLPYLIPVSTFTGVLFSVGQAARHREIVATKAGGVSPLHALLPIFMISAGISLVSFVLNETITLRAASAVNARTGSSVGEVTLRSGSIWYHTGRIIYNIRDPRPEGQTVLDVRVFERNEEGRLIRLIHAREAERLAPHQWRFVGATIRSFDPLDAKNPPVVERAEEIVLELGEDRTPHLQQAELVVLPLATLAGYVGDVLDEGGNPGRARALLHSRLTIPFLVILFALLAVPLGLSVEQTRSLAMPALQGVGLLFVFLILREYSASFGARGELSAALAPWLTLLIFFALGGWRLSRVHQ